VPQLITTENHPPYFAVGGSPYPDRAVN